jgi:chemotaxis receptor (MCP) glutamine deamidase CheD
MESIVVTPDNKRQFSLVKLFLEQTKIQFHTEERKEKLERKIQFTKEEFKEKIKRTRQEENIPLTEEFRKSLLG